MASASQTTAATQVVVMNLRLRFGLTGDPGSPPARHLDAGLMVALHPQRQDGEQGRPPHDEIGGEGEDRVHGTDIAIRRTGRLKSCGRQPCD